MSLITRCPKCATAFRATREQLSKRAGRVRCGKCGEVFDGIKALVEQGSEPLAAAAAETRDTAQTQDTAALPAFMAEKVRPPRALWWSLCALALLLLAGQAVYHYRAELASRAPWSRAPLVEACRQLGCEVPLPRQLGLLTIDSYEVRADPRRDGVILLTAVIRNRAPYAQAYPALQFALTDDSGKQVVSRVLRPAEYLERMQAKSLIDKGIAPSGEAELNVYFDTSRTRASGYRLELFYPS